MLFYDKQQSYAYNNQLQFTQIVDLKIFSNFWDGKRRSEEFHPNFQNKHRCTTILSRRIKPVVSLLFEGLYAKLYCQPQLEVVVAIKCFVPLYFMESIIEGHYDACNLISLLLFYMQWPKKHREITSRPKKGEDLQETIFSQTNCVIKFIMFCLFYTCCRRDNIVVESTHQLQLHKEKNYQILLIHPTFKI